MRVIKLHCSLLGLLVVAGIYLGYAFLKDPIITKKTDPTFDNYIVEFELAYGIQVTTPIIFDTLKDSKSSVVATCHYWSRDIKIIKVKPKWWKLLNEAGKEQLIFHELGHCELEIFDHTDGMREEDFCPVSIMRSYIFSEWELENCYLPHREYYIQEMRKQSPHNYDLEFVLYKVLRWPFVL